MATKPGLINYLTAAFNARPFGMFVAPNWIGLGAFGLLGLVNPGFWVLGAGLELGYLLALSTNGRFQRTVAAQKLSGIDTGWDQRIRDSLSRLSEVDRQRYAAMAALCRSIIELQLHGAPAVPEGLEAQRDGLARLSWMYLRLLVARTVIHQVLGDGRADSDAALRAQLSALERRAAGQPEGGDLRRSLEGQIDILRQRLGGRAEGQQKLAYIDAELARIEQQGELIREQAALSTDPVLLSHRIDEIAATLGGTAQWIRDQQQVYGAMDDLLSEPPRPALDARARETE